jgi:hypothetical protein
VPVKDLPQEHSELYRIRLGDKDDKNRPKSLRDSMRITSPNKAVVEAFVKVYGGDVTQWEQEWQAYLPTNALPVLMLPGQSYTQWWERYKGSVCDRRCDGEMETLSLKPCQCSPDIVARSENPSECSIMTRLRVICPEVAVVGAGALVTHSLIAARTLPQSIRIAEAALARGLMVPATLRTRSHDTGKRHYIIVQLEVVGMTIGQLETGESGALTTNGRALNGDQPALTAGDSDSLDADRLEIQHAISELSPEAQATLKGRWVAVPLPPVSKLGPEHVEKAWELIQATEASYAPFPDDETPQPNWVDAAVAGEAAG